MRRAVSSISRIRATRSFVFTSTPKLSKTWAAAFSSSGSTTGPPQFWNASEGLKQEESPFATSEVVTTSAPGVEVVASSAADVTPALESATPAVAPKAKKPAMKKTPPELVRAETKPKKKRVTTVHAAEIATAVATMYNIPKNKSKQVVDSVFDIIADVSRPHGEN
jgi:hypothetical protein